MSAQKSLGNSTITLSLEIHINHLAILIYCPSEVMLLAVDFDEDFINEERIAVGDDVWRESVPFVCIHHQIIECGDLPYQYPTTRSITKRTRPSQLTIEDAKIVDLDQWPQAYHYDLPDGL